MGIDIFKFMKQTQNNLILASFMEDNYQNIDIDDGKAMNDQNNTSLLSISGVSSMVHSMFEYLVPSHTNSDDETDDDDDEEEIIENGREQIAENTKIIFVPIM